MHHCISTSFTGFHLYDFTFSQQQIHIVEVKGTVCTLPRCTNELSSFVRMRSVQITSYSLSTKNIEENITGAWHYITITRIYFSVLSISEDINVKMNISADSHI